MNKSFLAFAAVAALATGAAFVTTTASAGEVDPVGQFAEQVHSNLARAEVQAQLSGFYQGLNPWAQDHDQLAHFDSARTRAQVRTEFLEDREEAAAMTAEDSGSAYLSKLAAVRTVREYLAGTPANAQ